MTARALTLLQCQQGSPEWHRARLGVLTASRADQLISPGPEPRMLDYFALADDAPDAIKRAPAQTGILDTVRFLGRVSSRDEAATRSPSAWKALREAGHIVPCDPPRDAQPWAPPLELSAQRADLMDRLVAEWVTGASAEEWGGNKWTEHGHQHEGTAADAFSDITGLEPQAVGLIYRDADTLTACSPDWVINPHGDDPAGGEVKCPAAWTHCRWLRTGGVPREHLPQIQFCLWVTGWRRWYFISYAAPLDEAPWSPGASLPPIIEECEPDPRWQGAFDQHAPAFLAELLAARAALLERGATAAGTRA